MPKGVNVQVDDGFATIDFEDRSLRGPALAELRKTGAPIEVETRSGPRKRYRVPEGNAREAGLVDGSKDSLPVGDSGAAQALVDADPNVNPGEDEANWHHPVSTIKDNLYVGATTAEENMSQPSVSTTVSGGEPTGPAVAPLHSEVIASVKSATSTLPVADEETPDESWSVADLKAYAEARGIDLSGATRKADILDAINNK